MSESKKMVEHQTESEARLGHLKNIIHEGIDPFPARSRRTHTLAEAKISAEGTSLTVAGRIMTRREMGKLTFCHLHDESGNIQIVLTETELEKIPYKFFNKNFDIGDFLEVEGTIFTTHKGEISILVKKYFILSKALLPLPEKWHGLSDQEARYRKRYLDLISNPESIKIAKIRSVLVKEIRSYFDSHGFFEVETPVLQTLYGGALAKPFKTHHNALDIPLYLRIAPELYLKRLIVGGFEKVYEIAKCFRNEGIDQNHNPEFTQIEFYWAYADYQMLMDLVEDLLPKLITSIGLSLKFEAEGETVDFTPPYKRITMRELIRQHAQIDIEDYPEQGALFKKAKELQIDNIDSGTGRGKLIDEIYKKFARPNIINPIFVIDHPVELSPLAKRKVKNLNYVERFQLLCVGGNELCNAFSELNDPIDQEERFKEQLRLEAAGDDESMPYDTDFVEALMHGMPPTAGMGMGIDRLVKLLTNAPNLKEVILFPTLRPESNPKE
ncbi:MAG: lysine--tRNA ligase [Patescibacteria group bacterium]|jgi:lysyl-tRNA synthetase class 2